MELRFKGNDAYIQNTAYSTVPLIVHGNGRSKLVLNSLGNYVSRAWSPEEGCLNCWDNAIELPDEKPHTYPRLLIAIFIEKPMPFVEEFFDGIQKQTYPKSKLHLFIHNAVPHHESNVLEFIKKYGLEYKSVKQITPEDAGEEIDEAAARNLAM